MPITGSNIAAGNEHTCAIVNGGDVMCWGNNNLGQLGDGTTGGSSSIPSQVIGLSSPVTGIAAGGNFTCAVIGNTNVQCWGENNHGQIGNGAIGGPQSSPAFVATLTSVLSLELGQEHACVVTLAGDAWCWGRNDKGQLGTGLGLDSPYPLPVSGVTNYTTISAGQKHTCAVTTGGGVKCWGLNDRGQLGDNTHSDSGVPVTVVSLPGQATVIGTGDKHSCAGLSGRGPVCWGLNDKGQLGHTLGDDDPVPVDVQNLGEIDVIVGGEDHTCAATAIEVWCWGENGQGQLGDGTNTDSDVPVTVMPPEPVIGIATGLRHSCYMEDTREVYCWGENGKGQLGDGTTNDSNVPVDVIGLP